MKHLTIISADRVGLLADISYILGSAKINIETLAASTQGGKCIVGISVKDERRATELLRKNGFEVLENEMLVVRIKDEPAQMAAFTSLLSKEKVSVVAMHPLATDGTYDTFALKVDHTAKAKRLLSDYLIDFGEVKK
jgi:hypothetical protein